MNDMTNRALIMVADALLICLVVFSAVTVSMLRRWLIKKERMLANSESLLSIMRGWAERGYDQHQRTKEALGQVKTVVEEAKHVVASVVEKAGDSGVLSRTPKSGNGGTVPIG